MEDHDIVALYWARDEGAIAQTERKYGGYLLTVAMRILADREDGLECVNDSYLRAWNSMPPQRPQRLSTYLGRLTRQGAIDLLRGQSRQKRRGTEYALSLSELEDCVADSGRVEQELAAQQLAEAIGRYLRSLKPELRNVFLCRYYFCDSVRELAAAFGCGESKIKSMLHRTRQGLRAHLEQEGFM